MWKVCSLFGQRLCLGVLGRLIAQSLTRILVHPRLLPTPSVIWALPNAGITEETEARKLTHGHTGIHGRAAGNRPHSAPLALLLWQLQPVGVSTSAWAWLGPCVCCVAAVTANCSVNRGSVGLGSRSCCPNSDCGSRLSHISVPGSLTVPVSASVT